MEQNGFKSQHVLTLILKLFFSKSSLCRFRTTHPSSSLFSGAFRNCPFYASPTPYPSQKRVLFKMLIFRNELFPLTTYDIKQLTWHFEPLQLSSPTSLVKIMKAGNPSREDSLIIQTYRIILPKNLKEFHKYWHPHLSVNGLTIPAMC